MAETMDPQIRTIKNTTPECDPEIYYMNILEVVRKTMEYRERAAARAPEVAEIAALAYTHIHTKILRCAGFSRRQQDLRGSMPKNTGLLGSGKATSQHLKA
ncbi:uncharacterized protein DFL_000623 [Arthrobotrys flagrans]|uniref:Uncharacterized protein n=1 Tax=Arthrobotrys flagrans TaxID=97331 RepID=A0A437AEG9_ARTFL|nr:hypothetical protein DFL_000623 [Arthrobotrys flagrans]